MADPQGPIDEAALWRCVETMVREVLLPGLRDDADWARTVAVQLVGLARYAGGRGAVPAGDARRDELAGALDALADNSIVARHWAPDGDRVVVRDAVGRILAEAVHRVAEDADDPEAGEVRALLRAVVVRQLDDELALTSRLVPAFRGQLDA